MLEAVAGLSPVSITGRTPSTASSAIASRELAFTVSATAKSASGFPASARTVIVRPSRSWLDIRDSSVSEHWFRS